ncbi:MAG: gliding motility-associated C-terminal domain-containing protein [Salibacteraceae bacterium]
MRWTVFNSTPALKVSSSTIIALLLVVACWMMDLSVNAQTLERQVVGSAGGFDATGAGSISYTVGETEVRTVGLGGLFQLTQGFQQPSLEEGSGLVNLDSALVFNESCAGAANGAIFIENGAINGCDAPYTYVWSNGDTSRSTSNLIAGSYTITVTSNDGCIGIYTFEVGLEDGNPCELKFYSGLTPNGDGHNDTWIVDNIERFPDNEIFIVNRYGTLIWEGKNYNNTTVLWDGRTSNGNDPPVGTYFYIAKVGSRTYRGWVELTR